MGASGTPKWIKVEGITVFPDRDCNARLPSGRFEIEALPHAGGNQKKMLASSGAITGLTAQVTKEEYEKLQALNDDSRDNLSLSYKDAGNNVFRTTGFIKTDGLDDADNRLTMDLIPKSGEWVLFVA